MANETNEPRRGEAPTAIDIAQMWENLCLVDEVSADCLALAEGLAAQVRDDDALPRQRQ